MTSPVKRLTRAEKQEQTRAALVEAAMALFVERGVDATSIEDVVARAGYTRGAFYSNFRSRDELFVEVARRFLEQMHTAASGDGSIAPEAGDAMRARFNRLRAVTDDRGSVLLAEISLYSLRHPDLVEEIANLHRQQLPYAKAFARANLERAGMEDVDDALLTQLANITQSLTFGLHLFELINADISAEATAGRALQLLVRGLVAERKG